MNLLSKYKYLVSLILFFFIVSLSNVNAEGTTEKLKNLWGKVTENTSDILDLSLESLSNFTKDVGKAIDAELELLRSKKNNDQPLELQDKVDNIRIYVEKITDLKKKERDASSFKSSENLKRIIE